MNMNTENILALFNQEKNIIGIAKKYMLVSYAVIPAFILTFPLENLIEMMDILYPVAVIYFLANLVAASVGYLTCFIFNWGVYVIPLMPVSAFCTITFALIVYCKCSSLFNRIWPGFKWAGFQQWNTYFYYGLPILLTEWGLNVQVYASGLTRKIQPLRLVHTRQLSRFFGHMLSVMCHVSRRNVPKSGIFPLFGSQV